MTIRDRLIRAKGDFVVTMLTGMSMRTVGAGFRVTRKMSSDLNPRILRHVQSAAGSKTTTPPAYGAAADAGCGDLCCGPLDRPRRVPVVVGLDGHS
jgi:hypothetical protein